MSGASRKAQAVDTSARRLWSSSRQKSVGEGQAWIRLGRVLDSSAESILPLIGEVVAPGSVIITDGLPAYHALPQGGLRSPKAGRPGQG